MFLQQGSVWSFEEGMVLRLMELIDLRYQNGPCKPEGIELVEGFEDTEFACRCCGKYWIHPDVLRGLATFRRIIHRPVIITSAYRCPAHNRAVGGAKNSFHTMGRAVDLYVSKLTAADLAKLAETVEVFRNGGIGIYTPEQFIHVDDGPKRRWRRINGTYS